jgi:hypothetical protein
MLKPPPNVLYCDVIANGETFKYGLAMPFLPIFYYGLPGLEADIFHSYMRCSGYPVRMLVTRTPFLPPLPDGSASVVVIALTEPPEKLAQFARELRMNSSGTVQRVFILANGTPPRVDDPGIEIIERPFRLSEVIKRIQVLNRQALAPA